MRRRLLEGRGMRIPQEEQMISLDRTQLRTRAATDLPRPKSFRERASRSLLVSSYVAAPFFPVLGLILGLILLAQQRRGHGIAVIGLSVAAYIGLLPILIGSLL